MIVWTKWTCEGCQREVELEGLVQPDRWWRGLRKDEVVAMVCSTACIAAMGAEESDEIDAWVRVTDEEE